MSARLIMPLVVAIALVAVFGGCGGDDDDSGSTPASNSASTSTSTSASAPAEESAPKPVTTSSLSKAAFVKQASAACRQKDKNLSAEEEAYLEKQVAEGALLPVALVEMIKAVLVPKIEAKREVISNLGAPKGDEDQIEAILAAQQEGIDEVSEVAKLETNQELESYFTKATKALENYGLAACGDLIP